MNSSISGKAAPRVSATDLHTTRWCFFARPDGGPLADGIVHGRKVACPLHNWIINLEDGEATGADKGCARSFPVKLENGRIYLDMNVAATPSNTTPRTIFS